MPARHSGAPVRPHRRGCAPASSGSARAERAVAFTAESPWQPAGPHVLDPHDGTARTGADGELAEPPAGPRFSGGVDLHARSLFLVVLDTDGQTRLGRNLTAAPAPCARLRGAVQNSGNKRAGDGNRKAGNAWLKWAFSEAAVLSAQKDERIGGLLNRLAAKLGKAKGYSALAHKLGRAFYHMLRTKEVFDVERFVRH